MESVCSTTDQSGAVTPPQILDGYTPATDMDNRLQHELFEQNTIECLQSNTRSSFCANTAGTNTDLLANTNTAIYEQYMTWLAALSTQWSTQQHVHTAQAISTDYDMMMHKWAGKQRLALLDVHNLTELETLAVTALADMHTR
jgi:hypothetical protein